MSASIRQAIEVIDQAAFQIGLVVDEERVLHGVITDGDIRRAFLHNHQLDEPITTITTKKPFSISTEDAAAVPQAVIKHMRFHSLHHIPIIDAHNRVVGLEYIDNFIMHTKRDNIVFIMAGGLGTRLKPLTDDLPKPLLTVGGYPMLELLIRNFASYGFYRFVIAVNYKADLIMQTIGNGEQYGVEVDYVIEQKKLGTAGALSLLNENPAQPMIVTNADILTNMDFAKLLQMHEASYADVTLCSRQYQYTVPFGVLQVDGADLVRIEEKPQHTARVNAGIYVFNPSILKQVPHATKIDMPMLLQQLLEKNYHVATYSIDEYWLDVGRVEELKRAQLDCEKLFWHELLI